MQFFYSLISIPQILRLKKIASKSAFYYNSDTIEELDKIISSRPRLAMAYFLRGRAKKELESMDDYNYAIYLDSKYQEAYYFRGNLKEFYGDQEGAYKDYVRATEADKALTRLNRTSLTHNIYYNIGSFLFSKDKYEESIDAFITDIESNPFFSLSYLYRGKAKYYLMDYEGAISDLNEALELSNTDQEAYKYRGLSKKALGDLEGYKSDYKFATTEIFEIQDESDTQNLIKNTKVVFKNVIPTPSYFDWENHESHYCPECNSRDIGKLSYGLPNFESPELLSRIEKENTILAGCVVSDDSPLYRCKNCGTEWGLVNFSGRKDINETKECIKRKILKFMQDEISQICDKKRISIESSKYESIVFEICRIFESIKRILIDEENEENEENSQEYSWIYNYYSDANDLMSKYSDLRDIMNQVGVDDVIELGEKLEYDYSQSKNYNESTKENNEILRAYYLEIVTKLFIEMIESDHKRMNKIRFVFNKRMFSKFEICNLNLALLLQVHKLLKYSPEKNHLHKNSRAILLIQDFSKKKDHIIDIIKSLSDNEIKIISENVMKRNQPQRIMIEPTFESFKERLKRDS